MTETTTACTRPTLRAPGITILNEKRAPSVAGPISTAEASTPSACFALSRELWELSVVARFTVPGEPVSKARARFTKYGSKTKAYTPEKTTQAEQNVGWRFRAAAKSHRLNPDMAYGVMVLFFNGTRQRRDVDNMLKLILDGLNGVAWPDDCQVSEVSAKKTLVLPDEARTEVLVYQVGPVQRFTSKCEHCGTEYPVFASTVARQRFCSKKCHNDHRRTILRTPTVCGGCGQEFIADGNRHVYCSQECKSVSGRVTVSCSGCGTEFTRQKCHVRTKNFCSAICRDAAMSEQRKSRARGVCETCGGPTSKKTYRQCQACLWGGAPVSGKPKRVVA